MSGGTLLRQFDDLEQMSWPLSALYHEESKLTPLKAVAFQEAIAAFNADPEAVRGSAMPYKYCATRSQHPLPRAGWRGRTALARVLRRRRTRRGVFARRALRSSRIGALLDLACGETGAVQHPEFADVSTRLRAWPSAGALYPLEVYVAAMHVERLAPAIYHHCPRRHALGAIAELPAMETLSEIVYASGMWAHVGAMLILTGRFARTQVKYGERGYRFVLLDAGHLAQNILLVAEALRLAAIPIGGFCDDRLGACLRLDPAEESPLYVILLGER